MKAANTKLLTPADTALLATLTSHKRTRTLLRLAAAQAIMHAPTGKKNHVTELIADSLGCSMSHAQSQAIDYRKSGLAGIIPRNNQPNKYLATVL